MDLNLSDLLSVSLPAIKTPPIQFACMSISEDREVHTNSTECLRAFISPPIGINLKGGLHIYRRREVATSQIVTHRGLVAKLLWGSAQQLNAFLYDGVLYIEVYDPQPDRVHTFVKDGECIGSNFEALCTGEYPNGIHDLHARWCAGVTFNLGDLKILVSGEVDCQKDSNFTGQVKDCLELKTKKQDTKQPPAKLRWYFQSSIIGVPTIVLGWQKGGVLTGVDMIDVVSMVNETTLQRRYDDAAIFLSALRRHCMAHVL